MINIHAQAASKERPDTPKRKEWDVMCPSIAKVFGLMSKGNPVEFVCVCSYTYVCGVWKISNFPFTLQPITQTENTERLLKNTKILPLFSRTECSKNSPGSENILLLIQSAWLQRAVPLSQPLETSTTLTFAQILPTDTHST